MKTIKALNNIDLFEKFLFIVDTREEDLRRRAAEAAAAELGCPYGTTVNAVRLFSDCTGNYAEVVLPTNCEYSCGMKLCCIVDTDTMEVRGICPVD